MVNLFIFGLPKIVNTTNFEWIISVNSEVRVQIIAAEKMRLCCKTCCNYVRLEPGLRGKVRVRVRVRVNPPSAANSKKLLQFLQQIGLWEEGFAAAAIIWPLLVAVNSVEMLFVGKRRSNNPTNGINAPRTYNRIGPFWFKERYVIHRYFPPF